MLLISGLVTDTSDTFYGKQNGVFILERPDQHITAFFLPLDTNPSFHHTMLIKIRSTKGLLTRRMTGSFRSQEPSYTGLASGPGGTVLSTVICANSYNNLQCQNLGIILCTKCSLVRYCSDRCRRQHRIKHRLICEHELRRPDWRPRWIIERRIPKFQTHPPNKYPLWDIVPGFNCLGLQMQVPQDVWTKNIKLCFNGSSGLSHIIQTVNSLPLDFQGDCDILFNNTDATVVNRHLITLYALLSSGSDQTIEESAEIATHLLYSSFLPLSCSQYLTQCVNEIYGKGPEEGDMSFHGCFETRGPGKIHTTQAAMSIRRPVEMIHSSYGYIKAKRSLHDILLQPPHIDDRHRFLMKLKPAQRLPFMHYWETAVLAPFSLNVGRFNHPNRLHFSPRGEWLGYEENPFQGWDVQSILSTGSVLELDDNDMMGCLFFHIKSQLMKFASRIQYLHINIHLTQFDVRILSKGICSGIFPPFGASCFDRIYAGDLMDKLEVDDCVAALAPLLNNEKEKVSKEACIFMYSRTWYQFMDGCTARDNPRLLKTLLKKAETIPGLKSRLKGLNEVDPEMSIHSISSPSLLRLIDFIDAFVDHEPAFMEFMNKDKDKGLVKACEGAGLRIRRNNWYCPKRFGLPLDLENTRSEGPPSSPPSQLPGLMLGKEEFYNLFVLGGASLTTRFLEIEPIR